VNKKIVLTLLLTVLMLLSLTVSLASATTTETFTVNPPSTTQFTFNLPKDTTFNASILTSGTIRVWVTNSGVSQIVNLGLVDQTANLEFTASQDGNYSVNFENDLPNAVQVTFSYDTNPQVSGTDSTLIPLSYLPVFIAIVVLGSIFLLFLVRRKNRKAPPSNVRAQQV
jgi:maltose-binding protein MalE